MPQDLQILQHVFPHIPIKEVKRRILKETKVMRIKMFSRGARFFVICLLTVGCGVTGRTKPFTLLLPTPVNANQMKDIKIGSVELGEDSTRLVSVGTIPWGKFSSQDLVVFDKSLRNTISKATLNPNRQSDSALQLYIIVRRYLTATSNNKVTVLACIAWCATDQNGKIVYHEQFYASKSSGFVGTVGSVKNSVNKSIVSRIAQTAINIASLTDEAAIEPVLTEDTFNSFEEAAKGVPGELASYYSGSFDLGSAYYFYFGWAKGRTNLDWAEQSHHINWNTYLVRENN